MKKHGLVSKVISTLLVLAMMPVMPTGVSAELTADNVVGGNTGLKDNKLDTNDTISLPIRIMDYEADGILFEFSNSKDKNYTYSSLLTELNCKYLSDYFVQSDSQQAVLITNKGKIGMTYSYDANENQYLSMLKFNTNYTNQWLCLTAFDSGCDIGEAKQYSANEVSYMAFVYKVPDGNGYDPEIDDYKLQFVARDADGMSGTTDSIALKKTDGWVYDIVEIKHDNPIASVYFKPDFLSHVNSNNYNGNYTDQLHILCAAYFSDKNAAERFGEYCITLGFTAYEEKFELPNGYIKTNYYDDHGHNKAFGLLGASSFNPNGTTTVADFSDTVVTMTKNNYYLNSDEFGYRLIETIKEGVATYGLLESELENGYPKYKEEVLTHIVNELSYCLDIPEYDGNGWKNYRYIDSYVADVLRHKIDYLKDWDQYKSGNYSDTQKKADKLIGKSIEEADITTLYDAAYYLLNNIFIPDAYNTLQDDYNYLVLSAATDSITGYKTYVFDGGFTSNNSYLADMAVDYNKEDKTIQNIAYPEVVGEEIVYKVYKAQHLFDGRNVTNMYPFLPITDKNNAAGQTKSPYIQDDGVINIDPSGGDTLINRNFNFAMVSEGEFVYWSEDNLFFEFEGDDDVYLFINDQLVLDIGGAHSITKVRINLNDYVTAARAGILDGTLAGDERNAALALEDGKTYSFKFYYMERHSYGSNIRISTNIRVTDPAMKTEKLAWQGSTQLPYGSVVEENSTVTYGFSITNTGGGTLSDFTFTDDDIDVKLDPVNGYTKNGIVQNNFNLQVTIAGDTTPVTTNSALRGILDTTMLALGETITISGFDYKIPNTVGIFDNIVYSTAVSTVTGETLPGQAKMRVYIPGDPIYYQWVDHEIVVTYDEWLNDIWSAGKVTTNQIQGIRSWFLVDENGNEFNYSYVHRTGTDDKSLSICYSEPGIKMFFIQLNFVDNSYVRIPVFVNVADVEDSTIVLDYGLPVSISATELTKNDAVDIFGSDNTWSIIGFGYGKGYANNEISFDLNTNQKKHSGTYGDFVITDNIITYTPDTFLKGVEEIDIAVNVYNENTTPNNLGDDLDINNEVEMYKTIRIVPANVMYYEDDFAGITYTIAEGEKLSLKNVETGEFEEYDKLTVTDRSEDLTQSDDQDMNYGYDPKYAAASNNETSLGSMHKILLNSTEDFSFTFQGTGFELIGRTNAKDTGTIIAKKEDGTAGASETGETHNMLAEAQLEVEVVTTYPAAESAYSMSGETMFTSRKIYPVIMEFDNGNDGGDDEICQVPVLRIDGLDYGTHTVTVTGVQAYEWNGNKRGDQIPTYFYFDGLRIYQPLGDDDTHYNKYEKDAKFEEIRDLIIDGEAAVASYDESLEISKIGTGNHVITWTENLNEDYEKTDDAVKDEVEINTVDSVDDYLIKGPNNEVYMLDNETSGVDSGIFFFVKEPSPETKVGTPSLQVAVRAIDFGKFIGTGSTQTKVRVQYNAMNANGNYAWTDLVPAKEIVTGTELYYDIDYTKCPKDENSGTYMVALRVYSDAAANNYMASYTSLKLTGGLSIATEWEYNSNGFVYDSGSNNETTYSAEYTTSENLYNTVAYAMIEQLKSDIIITSSDAGSTPEIDDPLQNLPETNDPETDDDNTNDGEEESSKPSNFDLLKLFTLTAIAGEGGTITPEGDLIIAFGASRTFKFIPDEGYEIADVLVNGKSVGAVEKYVLKAAHADTVVEVLFREIPEAAADAEAAAEEAAG